MSLHHHHIVGMPEAALFHSPQADGHDADHARAGTDAECSNHSCMYARYDDQEGR